MCKIHASAEFDRRVGIATLDRGDLDSNGPAADGLDLPARFAAPPVKEDHVIAHSQAPRRHRVPRFGLGKRDLAGLKFLRSRVEPESGHSDPPVAKRNPCRRERRVRTTFA